jgi:transcriptional regulator with XRE-family HTH domain
MWLDRILEAKKEKGITTKSIADSARLPEKTVARILSGKTQAPYVDTVIVLGAAVGLSPREIFSETGLVVGDQDCPGLQEEVTRLTEENAAQAQEILALRAEVGNITAENKLLALELKHKDEILAVHDHYIKRLEQLKQ